jgi:WD40 repeat protein
MSSPTLTDLIARWKDAHVAGRDLSANELCREHPELAEELQRALEALRWVCRNLPLLSTVAPELGSCALDANEKSPPADSYATIPPATVPPPPLPPPAPAGYELLGELGRGGMGVVYKATQVKLGRLVALKMILAGGHAGADDLARFRTEAEAIARLQHPNIVQVFEVGEYEGKPFFSLEFCPGGTLADKLAGTPIAPREAARLVETLARAMHAAHRKGVVHRDLKPGNVLLAEDGTQKITDFGLAKKLEEAGHTQTGAVMGTPSYMAPEQAEGKPAGPAADVYALGALLYECLTGRPPFKAATTLDTLMQVVADEPVPPRQLQTTVPADVETICLKCLRKEPAQRYGSAEELAGDLRRFQSGEPIMARPVSRAERAWRWCRRNPAVASLLGVTTLTLLCGILVASAFAVLADRNARDAAASALRANSEKQAAERERAVAVAEGARANRESERARRSAFDALRNLYLSRMNQAHLAWQAGQLGRMRDLLVAETPARSGGHDFRAFEWHYLNRLANPGMRTYSRFDKPVVGVAFSPDGKLLAVCSGGPSGRQARRGHGEIIVLQTDTGKVKFRHKGDFVSAVFSPDGKHLAAAGSAVKVWVIASGKEVESVQSDGGVMASSPDGQWLAFTRRGHKSGAAQVVLKEWAVKKEKTLDARTNEITGIAFSPDGKRLLVEGLLRPVWGGPDGVMLSVWDLQTVKEILRINLRGWGGNGVAWSGDGKLLASCAGNTVRVRDANSGRPLQSLTGHTSMVSSFAFSPDSQRLASASWDQTVRVWDALAGTELLRLRGHTDVVKALAFHPSSKLLASAGADHQVKLWDLTRDPEVRVIPYDNDTVLTLAFAHDGTRLVAKGLEVRCLDADTGRLVHSFKKMLGSGRVAISPDGKRLASVSLGARGFRIYPALEIWDSERGKQLFSWRLDKQGEVSQTEFSPDGQRVAFGMGGTVQVWDVTRGKKLLMVGKGDRWVHRLAFSPDGSQLAVESHNITADGKLQIVVRLWDAETGREKRSFPAQENALLALAFTERGKRLAVATSSRYTEWDAGSGAEVSGFCPTLSMAAAIAPHGARLATIGNDGRVTIWDTSAGQQVLSLRGFIGAAFCLQFSPRGNRLAAGGIEGQSSVIRVWDARPWKAGE